MNETLLILHILSAAAWIGAGFYNAFLGPSAKTSVAAIEAGDFAAAGAAGKKAAMWGRILAVLLVVALVVMVLKTGT